MLDFFKGKKVFITGHTGFKGTWLCEILINAGAIVKGYALEPATEPNLFSLSGIGQKMKSIIGDIRDFERLKSHFLAFNPDIAIHLAAQPLVRESYLNPRYTYDTNVMGTVNFLECVRLCPSVKSVLNVTTDKVYKNNEWEWGYRETDQLNGFDPYSNSKSCSDIITDSYRSSFFKDSPVSISTARAGNVIGGGDFSMDRIIPDCVRSAIANTPIIVRNPASVRPYQHVIEPLFAYLLIVQKQYGNKAFEGAYNVGPDESDCIETGKLVTLFCEKWNSDIHWINQRDHGPHEANFLKLDCSKIKTRLKWHPVWGIATAIDKTVEWTKGFLEKKNIDDVMEQQIKLYESHFAEKNSGEKL